MTKKGIQTNDGELPTPMTAKLIDKIIDELDDFIGLTSLGVPRIREILERHLPKQDTSRIDIDKMIQNVMKMYHKELDKKDNDTDSEQDNAIKRAMEKEVGVYVYNYFFDERQKMKKLYGQAVAKAG